MGQLDSVVQFASEEVRRIPNGEKSDSEAAKLKPVVGFWAVFILSGFVR